MINITENRRSVFEMGMLAMLTMQFLFVGLVAWKMLVPGEANSGSLDSSVRQQVYGEVIDSIVNQKTGEEGVLEKLTTANLENTRLSANLDGQILRGNTLEKRLQDSLRTVEMLKREKSDLEVKNGQLADNNNSLKVQLKELGVEPKTEALDLEWVWWSLGSIALVVAGGAVGFLVGQRKPHEGEAVTSYESIAEESETPGERLRLDDRDSASD